MLKRTSLNKLLLIIMTLFMCLSFSMSIFADEVDNSHNATLTINSVYNTSINIEGIKYKLYKVATMNASNKFDYEVEFSGCTHIEINNEEGDDVNWANISLLLLAYAQENNIDYKYLGTSDVNGELVLTIEPGLYLVDGEGVRDGDNLIAPTPFMVAIPTLTDGHWDYDVVANAKITSKVVTDVAVHKIWNDNGNTTKRPNNLEVKLLKDGVLVDTVELNAGNGWSYIWKNLDPSYTYLVNEEIVNGYTSTLNKEGITFVFKNTLIETPQPKDDDDTLPDTGLLWWPVPIMISFGLIMIATGLYLKNEK